MLEIIALLLVFIVTLLFIYNWQKTSYWKKKGVPTPPVIPFIGHLHKFLIGCRWENVDKFYYKFKGNKYYGVYECLSPSLHVTDPALLRYILVKDADHFIDRRVIKMTGADKLFSEMLTSVKGDEWKSLRSLMSPTFSSGKIKAMFPLIAAKGDDLVTGCEKIMKKDGFVDLKSILGYYTLDVIATCALGFDAKCIDEQEESVFIKHARDIMSLKLIGLIKIFLLIICPRLFSALGLQLTTEGNKFFIGVVEKNIKLRKDSGVKRGDFLDIMLEALEEAEKNKSTTGYPMTMNTVIAESVLFLMAGFDTTANTLSFVVYLLSKNKDTQKCLREELRNIIDRDGELNYQNVMEASYLDACLSETLRLYSPAHVLERCCTKTYRFPDSDLEIPVDTIVSIPVWSLHRDSEYWEDPLSFDPDRFVAENKQKIIPYSYMPFGLGPRNCIGMRFAHLEAKLAIAKFFLNFEADLRPGFNEIKLDQSPSTLRPDKDGVPLVLKKLDITTK